MDFVEGLGDTTNLPEFAVGGIGRAEIIDDSMVRVTFYRPCAIRGAYIPILELIWTITAWHAARTVLAEVAGEIARAGLTPQPRITPDVTLRHH